MLKEIKRVAVKRHSCRYQTHQTANYGPVRWFFILFCESQTNHRIYYYQLYQIQQTGKETELKREKKVLMIESRYQIPHNVDKPWIVCTIYCRQSIFSNVLLRQKLLENNINPYFLNGTWCHKGQNYYCHQHYCLSENYSFVESEKCKNNC